MTRADLTPAAEIRAVWDKTRQSVDQYVREQHPWQYDATCGCVRCQMVRIRNSERSLRWRRRQR